MTEGPDSAAVAPGPAIDAAGLALLAAIVESSDDAIVSKTLEGEIRSWNAGATRIFGYQPDEMIGRSITTIIPPELQDEEREILAKLRRGERVDHFDTIRLTKDGRRVPLSLTISPVRDANGKVIGASKVARDISERKIAEELLRDAARRKDEFLALLAHELRNPLAPVRYALELMRRPGLSSDQRAAARAVIERQVGFITRLLDDLLDVSRITQGKLALMTEPTDLQSIIAIALESAQPILDARRHRLITRLPAAPIRMDADPVRLAQVFANLLINAAKFTDPNGRIEIDAVIQGPSITVTVRDNGMGIPEEMMPRLFTMFSQASAVHTRPDSGLGVGLSLARGLLELHGGHIEAHSAGIGLGSEFVVRLPLAAGALYSASSRASIAPASTELRVLVVDDNQDATDCCKKLLELSGYRVETAYTATRGLQLAEQFHPEIMLLDIGLPDLNGYEMARRIRGADWGIRPVLIAVTGWGQSHDRQRAYDAGFDHHVTKPVAAERLEAILGSIAAAREAAAADLHSS
jgi:PAS domain S-box-containing protein